MATATYNATTITPTPPSSTRMWLHLLWKDWRQVSQLIVGIVIVLAAMQMLAALIEAIIPTEMRDLANSAINIALAAPTLLAIGCCGMLIGHERQTGCWAWSSSLPVSWQQSLLSKTVIWFLSSIVAVAVLLAVSAIALNLNHRILSQELFQAGHENGLDFWMYMMTLVIAVQVFIYFSIAALLIKDTLLAFVVAAGGLLVFHVLISTLQIEAFLLGRFGREAVGMLFAYAVLFLAGASLLAVIYRWRWNAGQYAPIPLFGRTHSIGFVRPQKAAWQSFAGSATHPSEFWMLLYHGIRCAMGLRVAVIVLALPMIALSLLDRQMEPATFAACLASTILGVSVFSGDQTAKRFRFFADRGVAWKKMLAGHVLPPALMAALCVAPVGLAILTLPPAFDKFDYLFPLSLSIPCFIVGMLTSLVFASPIISLTITFVVLLAMFSFNVSAILLWEVIYPYGHVEAIALWVPVSTLILLVVTIRLVPKWLRVDQMTANGVYFASVLAAGLMPAVFGLTFGFLTVPNAPWQGLPLQQVKGLDWSLGPEIKPRATVLTESSSLLRTQDKAWYLNEFKLSYSIQQNVLAKATESSLSLKEWLATQNDLLLAIENSGEKPNSSGLDVTSVLQQMLKDSVAVAVVATQLKDKETAIRAWKANRKLIEHCQQPALQATTMEAVAFVWEAWYSLPDSDLKFLYDTGELDRLMPPAAISVEELRTLLQTRASIKRHLAQSETIDTLSAQMKIFGCYTPDGYDMFGRFGLWSFPPFQWAIERQQAAELAGNLAVLPRLSIDVESGSNNYSGHLMRIFFSMKFLEKKFKDRMEELRRTW